MTATLYGLPNCDTCRKARRWLHAAGIDFDFVDYRAQPVPAETLERWAGQLGGWDTLVNKSSRTWRQLPDKLKSAHGDDQWLRLLAEHPTLILRPVVETGDGNVSAGFSEARFETLFGSR